MPNPRFQDKRVDSLSTRDQDFHGRRVKNASDALDQQDYVTLAQLEKAIAGVAPTTINGQSTVTNLGVPRVYSLFKLGTLAIQSDCCQRSFVTTAFSATAVRLDLKQNPTGDDFIVDLYQNGIIWIASLTILDGTGTISATALQIAGAAALAVGDYFRADITQVGTTFPGADLTITIS